MRAKNGIKPPRHTAAFLWAGMIALGLACLAFGGGDGPASKPAPSQEIPAAATPSPVRGVAWFGPVQGAPQPANGPAAKDRPYIDLSARVREQASAEQARWRSFERTASAVAPECFAPGREPAKASSNAPRELPPASSWAWDREECVGAGLDKLVKAGLAMLPDDPERESYAWAARRRLGAGHFKVDETGFRRAPNPGYDPDGDEGAKAAARLVDEWALYQTEPMRRERANELRSLPPCEQVKLVKSFGDAEFGRLMACSRREELVKFLADPRLMGSAQVMEQARLKAAEEERRRAGQ